MVCVSVLEKKKETYHKSACQVSYRRVLMTKNQPVVKKTDVVSCPKVLTLLHLTCFLLFPLYS